MDFWPSRPFAPRFPFEMWILPKTHQCAFEESQKREFEQLAPMLKDMLSRLDRVLDFPAYNYIIHTSPIGESAQDYYHWHMEIMPKLTKVAGFEWGTGFYINPDAAGRVGEIPARGGAALRWLDKAAMTARQGPLLRGDLTGAGRRYL